MITLRAGSSCLLLAPETGGAIAGWTSGGVPVLRPPVGKPVVGPPSRGLSAFPLVPYSNRIGYARFSFGGQNFELDRNFGDEPHAIHGAGWSSSWRVVEARETAATIALAHDPAGPAARKWPFAFSAEQHVTLSPDALRIAFVLRNTDSRPAPAGLGLHPYFPRSGDQKLFFAAASVWTNAPDHLPENHVSVPPEWDHKEGRPVGSVALDNCFAGWNGRAEIRSTDRVIAIEASDLFRHLVVYTPQNRDYFAVEPVSHLNDAIHRMEVPGQGFRILEPGESLEGEIAFRLA